MTDRYVRWGEESRYGTAPASLPYRLAIAGESERLRQGLQSYRPERLIMANRQRQGRRSTQGSLDVYLDYVELAQLLRYICNTPTSEGLGSGAIRETFIPSPHFRPASLSLDIAREVRFFRYLGQFFASLRLSMGLGDKHFGASLSCLGADEADGGLLVTEPPAVFSRPADIGSTGAPTPFQLELSDGVTTWTAWIESLDLNFGWNRKLRQPERTLVPTGILGGGIATASGRVKWFYGSDTDWLVDAIDARTPVSLTLTMQGEAIGGGIYETLEVHLPVCMVNGDKPTLKNSGYGNIDFTADIEALHDSASGCPFRFRVTYGPFEQELLENPSAEEALVGTELPGWTEVLGSSWTRVGPGSGKPDGLSYHFYPGAVASAELRQDVDVSRYARWIDSGVQRFAYSGYVSTADQAVDDTARQIVEFRSAAGSVLSSLDSGNVAHPTTWGLALDEVVTAPVGTRTIRVRLLSTRNTGTNNDGIHDALSLKALRP